jgi:plastocyanin
MRRVLLVIAAFPALALAAAGAPAGVTVVTVTPRGFEPATISIRAGDTVTWTNTGSAQHQIVSNTGAFKPSPVLQPGQSFSFTFPAKGTFGYHDGLHETLKGTVTVAPPPPSVTIGSLRPSVTFLGAGTTLTGRVSSGKAGETVTVLARACGQLGTVTLGTVKTRANGVWRTAINPRRTTAYGAAWGRIPSPALSVAVMARLKLARSGAVYSLQVKSGSRLVGRRFALERFDETRQIWKPVATRKLRDAGTAFPETFLARASLKSPGGGRVRATISAAQAAPCYGASTSNVVTG